MYKKKHIVDGINYWTLYDGSTALINHDYKKRQATEKIKDYFIPGKVKGVVTNTLGTRMRNVKISVNEGSANTKSDFFGNYSIVVPARKTQITISYPEHGTVSENLSIERGANKDFNIMLSPKKASGIYEMKLRIMDFRKNFFNLFRNKN